MPEGTTRAKGYTYAENTGNRFFFPHVVNSCQRERDAVVRSVWKR